MQSGAGFVSVAAQIQIENGRESVILLPANRSEMTLPIPGECIRDGEAQKHLYYKK